MRLADISRRSAVIRSVVCLIAAIGLLAPGAVAQAPQKTVLALYAFRQDSPEATSADPVARRILDEGVNGRLDYYAEFIDLARFPDAEYQEAVRQFLRTKYQRKKFDVIMGMGGSILDFASRYRDDAASRDTPLVYIASVPSEARPNATGLIARLRMKDTLDTALTLQPDTERVVVVSGASPFDKHYEAEARAEFKPLEGRVAFRYLSGLPMRELVPQLSALPAHAIVFFTTLTEDGDGETFLPFESLDRLSAAANAPIYTWHHDGIDHGVIGGPMMSSDILATRIAQVALRVLHGERADTIPVAEVDASVNQFDWRQLRRWRISESRIPAGSTMLFRQRNAWDLYKPYIGGGTLLVLLQTAFIAALLVQRSRRRRAETALRESEERFHLMADTAPVLVWRAGVDERCDFFNRPWLEFTGRTMEQECGDGWVQGVFPDDLDRCLSVYHASFAKREPFSMEYRLRRADGVYRWILDSGVPRYGRDGQFAGFIGSCIDITDRRQAEDALRESQGRYALASAAGAVGVWDWNIETNDIYVDPNLKAILGFEDAEISSRPEDWVLRVHPQDAAAITTYAQLCVDGDTDAFEAEHRMLHKDGSVRWFLSRGSLKRRPDGAPYRLVGTDVDITERKRSAEQFRLAIEAAPAGMMMVDRAGTIVLINSQIERLFGYSRGELLGRPVEMLFAPRFRDGRADDRTGFFANASPAPGGAGRELFGLRKDGTEIPIEIGLNPFTTSEGEFVLGAVTDITERHAAERDNEELMRQLQRVAGRLIAAQESERSRIARDLHDDVSQQLAGLAIALSGLKRRTAASPGDDQLAGEISSLQKRTVSIAENIRNLSHDLHPSVLEHAGLVAALSGHCVDLRQRLQVKLAFRADGDFEAAAQQAALCLYRVAQEALRNAVTHAEARHVDVQLVRVGDEGELTIADDGKGFDIAQVRGNSNGLGLLSINERVRLVGGTVSIVTELHKGTRVCVRVPIARRAPTSAGDPTQRSAQVAGPLLAP